jgi:putative hydrolase of the HAD superfamily
MSPIEVVVFDIDDTLYLERDYVRSGFEAVGHWCQDHLGRPDFNSLAWDAFERGERGDIFDRVLRHWDLPSDQALVHQLVNVYRRHAPRIDLLPDAAECLARLRGRVALAAISDGPLASQQAKARRLGLDRWMDEIILTSAFGPDHEKPNPKAFLRIQEFFRCDGSRCVYVADNPAKDFQAPRELHWRMVRVQRQGGLHADAPCAVPLDLIAENLHGVPGFLGW